MFDTNTPSVPKARWRIARTHANEIFLFPSLLQQLKVRWSLIQLSPCPCAQFFCLLRSWDRKPQDRPSEDCWVPVEWWVRWDKRLAKTQSRSSSAILLFFGVTIWSSCCISNCFAKVGAVYLFICLVGEVWEQAMHLRILWRWSSTTCKIWCITMGRFLVRYDSKAMAGHDSLYQ